MQTSKLLAIVAVLIAVFAAVGYFFSDTTPKYDARNNSPSVVLSKTNEFYAQAQAAALSGNYQEAKPLYEKARGSATDIFQRGQIDFKLAFVEDHFGDPVKAIGLYKAIVANPEYQDYPTIKAYAVQSMAELGFREGGRTFGTEIFKDTPYASLVVDGNRSLTYRHLYEYATSFYPLGLAELRIAEWYAMHMKTAGADTAAYMQIIDGAVKLAEDDIERTKMEPGVPTFVPDILVRKAAVYVRLNRDQLATAAETEQFCKDALDAYASGPRYTDGFARYYYAMFLLSQGASREADLKAVLAPLYTDREGYKNSYIYNFFINVEKNDPQRTKPAMLALANKVPEFKSLLLSLGWDKSVF